MMIKRDKIGSIVEALSRLLSKPMTLEEAYSVMLLRKELKTLQDIFRTICILQKKDLTGNEILNLEPIQLDVDISEGDQVILDGIVSTKENLLLITA